MNFSPVIKSAFAGILLTLVSAKAVHCESVNSSFTDEQDRVTLPADQVRDRARAVTIKLIGDQGVGTGTLVGRNGNIYNVITNSHVLFSLPVSQVQTSDGSIHPVISVQDSGFGGNDLALIQFRSNKNYETAQLLQQPVRVGEPTYAAGFPLDFNSTESNFNLTEGTVSYLLPQPLMDGYQLGYTNIVLNGMSGGPVLNQRGELIGINGRGNGIVWKNPHIFADGSTPNPSLQTAMQQSSWAIPIQRVLGQIPQLASGTTVAFASQIPETSSNNNQANVYESTQPDLLPQTDFSSPLFPIPASPNPSLSAQESQLSPNSTPTFPTSSGLLW